MSLISAHGISKAYGAKVVLDGVSITIEDRDRLGLIGINGAGKSTLIRILLRREPPDSGDVQQKRGLTSAVVDQAPRLDERATVLDVVLSGQERNRSVRRRLQAIEEAIESAAPGADLDALVAEQAVMSEELERTGGWNPEHLAEAAMAALGLPPQDRRIGSLSMGELRRVALCAAFLERPELLVLDEPTNHLDVGAIEWLEVELAKYPGAMILVTHDRYFLERVANRHAELDRGQVSLYEGSYSEYLAERAERLALEVKVEHQRQRAIEHELEWVRRRAPARTTKQRARLERFDALVAARPKLPSSDVVFRLPHPPRIGKTILEIKGLSKSVGERPLIQGLDLTLKKGDRIGVVGPNGIGKTTLLRTIRGELTPDTGEIVLGLNTEISYADQRRVELRDDRTIQQEVAGDNDQVFVGEQPISVHTFLEGLLFDGAAQRSPIGSLSGGERSRVALAKALRVRANLLILDEPTNDLDLPTLRVLEEALLEFPGCALIVSHDRYFLDRVTTAILAFEGGGRIVLYEGSYDAYRARAGERAVAANEPPPAERAPAERAPPPDRRPKPAGPRKRTFNEEREFQSMESAILTREAEVAALEVELGDPENLRRLGAEVARKVSALEAARAEVERLYARWAELGSMSQ